MYEFLKYLLKKLERSFIEGLTCGENMPFRMASPYSCFGGKDTEINEKPE